MPRGRLARVLAFALAAQLALPCAPVFAGEPTAAQKETARHWILEGREKRKKGDLKGALERFRAAHQLMNVPTTGIEVGRAEADLGMLLEARDTLLAVTRIPVKPGEPEVFAKARAEAQDLADAIVARIPTLAITIAGPTSGVAITIDGVAVDVGTAHLPRKLNPGTYVVLARRGSVERKESVVLAEKDEKSVKLAFEDDAPAPAPVAPAKPVETPTSSSPLPWIGLGVAVVGLGVGTWAGLTSNSKAAELRDGCGGDGRCPPAMHDTLRSAKTFGTISTIGFIAAGVGAGVFVIGIVTRKSSEPTATAGARVDVGIGPGSLIIGGSF